MFKILISIINAQPVLAWSLIDPESDAIRTGVIKPNAVLSMLINSTTWIFGVLGAVALLVFIAGGVMWLISAGRSQLVDKGKQAMIGATLGMAVVFLSYSGVDFVLKTFGYNRYAEWSTLPQQAEPRGIEGGTGVGGLTTGSSNYAQRIVEGDPMSQADVDDPMWAKINFQTADIRRQIPEASDQLASLIWCMHNELPSGVGQISSISHSRGIVSCKTNYVPACEHGKDSCHFGGGVSNYSMAIDYGDEWNVNQIQDAANKCGVGNRVLPESTHVHVSLSACPKRY